MVPAIKPTLLSVVISFLFTINAAAQERPGPAELAGHYFAGHDFGGSTITLKAEGTYSDNSGSCTYSTEESGTFVVAGSAVRFKMLKYTAKQYGSEHEIDLFDNQARKQFFGYRDDEQIAPVTTDYTLLTVKWGGRIYLLDQDNLSYFANAINLGFEPRAESTSEPFIGSFYLREGDEKKRVSGLPSLAKEWLPFVLKKPVNATVVSVYGDERETIALINKGSRAGLKVGMWLVGKDEPSRWSRIEVISVEETFAKVQVAGEINAGDRLTTKLKRKHISK